MVEPVQGEVIPISGKKAVWLIGLCLVLVPVGVALVWLWAADTTIPFVERHVTWWGAIIGGFLVLTGLALPPLLLWQWLVLKERLVIGTEYLQVVVSKGGTDVVRKQIAFANIESATLAKHFDATVIAIQLRDVDAPDLVPSGGETLEKFHASFGFHLYLEDSYRMPVEDIRARIERATRR